MGRASSLSHSLWLEALAGGGSIRLTDLAVAVAVVAAVAVSGFYPFRRTGGRPLAANLSAGLSPFVDAGSRRAAGCLLSVNGQWVATSHVSSYSIIVGPLEWYWQQADLPRQSAPRQLQPALAPLLLHACSCPDPLAGSRDSKSAPL